VGGEAAAAPSASPAAVHWTQAQPLAATAGAGEGGSVAVNAADGPLLDEEAERRAFQEAVMEWRRGVGAAPAPAPARAEVAEAAAGGAGGADASPGGVRVSC